MANERAYWFVGNYALAANGQGTITFTVPGGEAFRAKRLWAVSTAGYQFTGIRDSGGREYANVSTGNPLPSSMMNVPQTAGGGVGDFPLELELRQGLSLYFDLLDISGAANTVYLVLEGIRYTP